MILMKIFGISDQSRRCSMSDRPHCCGNDENCRKLSKFVVDLYTSRSVIEKIDEELKFFAGNSRNF